MKIQQEVSDKKSTVAYYIVQSPPNKTGFTFLHKLFIGPPRINIIVIIMSDLKTMLSPSGSLSVAFLDDQDWFSLAGCHLVIIMIMIILFLLIMIMMMIMMQVMLTCCKALTHFVKTLSLIRIISIGTCSIITYQLWGSWQCVKVATLLEEESQQTKNPISHSRCQLSQDGPKMCFFHWK